MNNLLWLTTLLVALALGGCKPKVGGTCKVDGKESCKDLTTAFVCHEGKWEEMSCRGPKGCLGGSAISDCDQSLARLDEVCNVADNFTCADDKKTALQCKGNKWTLDEACLGPKGCALVGHDISCDSSLAKEGDKCTREDNNACTRDHKGHLVCKGGKFALTENCRGEKGCHEVGNKIDCDNSVAQVGEVCDTVNDHTCTADGKSIVKCNGSKWVADEACKGRKLCKVTGSEVGCQ
jgi:hypothetical protein